MGLSKVCDRSILIPKLSDVLAFRKTILPIQCITRQYNNILAEMCVLKNELIKKNKADKYFIKI